MNSLTISASAPPIVMPPQSSDVMTLASNVRQSAKNLRTSTMHLAYWGFRLRFAVDGAGGDWMPLGFELRTEDGFRFAETEDEVRESLGIGRSTWYKAISIGTALCELKLADMESITMANAEILTLVDPSIASDYPWVDEAKTLSSQELATRVTLRNRQSGSEKEPTQYYRVKVPITAKKFLEETVEAFRLEHGLASSGEALEMLIADVHDRPNAMTTMKTASQFVEWAMGRVKKRRPDSQEAVWLERAYHMLRKTYRAVRMESTDEEDAQEVYPAEEVFERKSRPTGEGIVSTKPYGSGDAPRAGRPVMEQPSGYMYPMLAPDEFDGNDDDVEDGV